MRKLLLVSSVAVASLGLAACGTTTQATIDQTVASLGASSHLQVRLTASVSGPGTAQVQRVLSGISLDMNYANPSGAALSDSGGAANSELTFTLSGTTFLDVRVIDSNLYLHVDLTPLSSLPGITITPSQLSTAQLVIGGRWFEIPKSLLTSLVPTSSAATAKAATDKAIARTVVDAIVKVIDSTPAKVLASGGYSEVGTLQSIVDAVAPTLQSLIPSGAAPSAVDGSYRLTLATSNSVATGASLSITAPNGSSGDVTVDLSATVGHANVAVDTPQGATMITPDLLNQFKSMAQSGSAFAAG